MRGNGQGFRGRGRGSGNQRGSHRGQRWNRGRRGGGDGDRGRDRPSSSSGHHQFKKFGPQDVGPRLAEVDVGITEFIGKHEGFPAVMKQRFSDFQVNEIDCEGNIVKLTTLDAPIEATPQPSIAERHELIPIEIWEKLADLSNKVCSSAAKAAEEGNTSTILVDVSSGNDATKSIEDKCSENDTKKSELCEENFNLLKTEAQTGNDPETCNSINSPTATNRVLLDVTSLDKDSRRIIHACVKKAFQNIRSDTIDENGKKFVQFLRGKDSRRERTVYPNGEYLYFVLHKRNMDTTETVSLISHKLGMKPGSLTFAGTKDRRGITSQLMCIKRGNPSRLFFVSKGLPNVMLGNYCFKTKPLFLGDLKGNQFRIALRNVQGSYEQIDAGLTSLKMSGFINYFGLQRFGTNITVPTHMIGKALLLGDWQRAVDLILEPRDNFPIMKPALNEWKTSRDAIAALKKLQHRSRCLEELLLQGLAAHGPTDFVNALSMIPLNTRLMYLHAYQSFIWNQTVSYRIREFGLKPIVGDLVLVRSEKETCSEDICIITEESVLAEAGANDSKEEDGRQEVRCISEDDISNYNIEDIVLPLPGHDVTYPINKVGAFLLDLLKRDGLSPEKLQNHVKQYSVKGTYRHIVAQANNVSWKVVHYNNSADDLIMSDYDEIKERQLPPDMTDGEFKAIILSMSLEPSTYATMAVREITKTDTSATAQVLIFAAAESSRNSKISSDVLVKQKDDPPKDIAAAEVSTGDVVEEEALEFPPESKGSSEVLEESSNSRASAKLSDSPLHLLDEKECVSIGNKATVKRMADNLSGDSNAAKRVKESHEITD